MRYIPHTAEDVRQMLEAIGVPAVDDLFVGVPAALRLGRPLALPAAASELELLRELGDLAAANPPHLSFLGGGAYQHFIPAVVDQLISRSEFYTAYTPYQPEISQGTLQAIFEFQTLVCQLTGMEVANASMYDGASACAEGVLMAVRVTGRKKVLLSRALHPQYRQTVRTYCRHLPVQLVEIDHDASGATDREALTRELGAETAAVVAGYPNYFGVIEDLASLAQTAHAAGAQLVTAVAEPMALGLLKAPGELGADIVAGEGQSFGIPLSFGGPYLGFFAARQRDIRQLPGRLVGETVDQEGRRGFVLTLSTREQHIRREKATSNICSNQGLCALIATVYLSLLGKEGLREVATQNLAKAAYARRAIAALPGYRLPFAGATFNEFVVESPEPAVPLLERLAAQGIAGGIALAADFAQMPNALLICVTEQHRREDIDTLIKALSGGDHA
jgi:glycine dehydrogenase subunit 1